jgi:ABC-type dipeptide/oligopeptide/nickel transport system ATPase component
MMDSSPLLQLRISAGYPGRPGVLRDLALELGRGEVLGLVGQSGCGKSTLALAILKLLSLKRGRVEGAMRFDGRDLMAIKEREMRGLRGKEMALVLQSPLASLNPALRVGAQLEEAWKIHRPTSRPGASREEWTQTLRETLAEVSLDPDGGLLRRYPAELSVGQAQRVIIGMAVLHRPRLLIADEPTSALDALTQSEILQLFSRLIREMAMGILFISHDLLSVASICNRVAILSAGSVVEFNSREFIFRRPTHAYTKALIASIPKLPASLSASRVDRHGFGEARGSMVAVSRDPACQAATAMVTREELAPTCRSSES